MNPLKRLSIAFLALTLTVAAPVPLPAQPAPPAAPPPAAGTGQQGGTNDSQDPITTGKTFENRGVDVNVKIAGGEGNVGASGWSTSTGNLGTDGYEARLNVGTAEGGYDYEVGIGENGLTASVSGHTTATLIDASARGQWSTDEGGFKAEGGGEAFVGHKANAQGEASIGRSGATLGGEAEIFSGAKAEGDVCVGGSCFGVSVNVKAEGDLRAGVGTQLKGNFKLSGGKFVLSGKVAGAIGLGAGIGAQVEIDVSELGETLYDAWESVKKWASDWWNSWWEDPADPPPPPAPPAPDPAMPDITSSDPFGDNTGVATGSSRDFGRDLVVGTDSEPKEETDPHCLVG